MPQSKNDSELNEFLDDLPGNKTLTSERFSEEFSDEKDEVNIKKEDSAESDENTDTTETEEDVEKEEEEEEKDELTELKKINQDMQRQMRLMEQKMEMLAQGIEKPTKEPKPEEEIDFLDGFPQDLDEVFTNKVLVNKLFNKLTAIIKSKAAEEATNKVTPVVDDRLEYQRFIDRFFQERGDLKKFDKYFYQIARDVASQNKGLSLKEVFTQAEKITRKDLNLPRKASGVTNKKSGGAIPSGRSSKRKITRDGKTQIDQILELIS